MAVHDMKVERQALDARARAILDDCPDVYRLIARGAAMDPEHDAIVYLRTALDPRLLIATGSPMSASLTRRGRRPI